MLIITLIVQINSVKNELKCQQPKAQPFSATAKINPILRRTHQVNKGVD